MKITLKLVLLFLSSVAILGGLIYVFFVSKAPAINDQNNKREGIYCDSTLEPSCFNYRCETGFLPNIPPPGGPGRCSDGSTPTRLEQVANPSSEGSAQVPAPIQNNQVAQASTTIQLTYLDICKEKAKKHRSFYLINDRECRLLNSNDFKISEEYDKIFKNYDALYKVEVSNKIDRSLSNQNVTIKSVYKKDNLYFADFKSELRTGLYNLCENKDEKYTKKDIFGNQATFLCDGEQYIVISDVPVITREISSGAVVSFIGSYYSSVVRDLFLLSPEEYVMIWQMYQVNGQQNMKIYLKDNVIMAIEQTYAQ